MSFPKIVIGVASLLLIGFIVIGFALPGTWDVTREYEVAAAPDEVWPNIVDLARWESWTSVGQVEATLSNPSAGVGATRSWNSEEWGSGQVEIIEADAPRLLSYRVLVQDGELRTTGRIELSAVAGGTRVVWREQGDFGWNPLLGYMALGMDRMQGREMEYSLTRLDSLVALGEPVPNVEAPIAEVPNDEAPSATPDEGR